MDGFCRTPLWNRTVSWDTDDPFISECFHHMILVTGSCGVLWILAPFEIYKITRHKGSPTPWTTSAIIKMALNVLLLNICVVELAKELYAYMHGPVPGADGLVAAVIYFGTIVLTVVLSILCKRNGLKVSLILPSFWMLSTVTTLLSMYRDIRDTESNDWIGMVSLVDDSLVFIISLIQLIFTIVSHKTSPHAGSMPQHDFCPLEEESLFSRLTFSWLLNVLQKGQDNSLHQDHLLPLCPELQAAIAAESFERAYKGSKSTKWDQQQASITEFRRLGLEASVEQGDIRSEKQPGPRSLGLVLISVSKKFLFINFILELLFTALYFLPVYLIGIIFDEVSQKDHFQWHYYIYSGLLLCSLLASSFADSQRVYYGIVAACRTKAALIDSIYGKLFRLASGAQKEHCQEDIKRYLTQDVEHVFNFVCRANELWGGLLRIGIGLYVLWTLLGSACFVGVAVATFLIPLNLLVAECAKGLQSKRHEARHQRLSLLSECFHSMKVLKLYAWEEPFIQRITSLRQTELSYLRKAEVIRTIFSFLTYSANSLVSLSAFTAYFLMKGGNVDSFDSKTIFLFLTFTFLLRSPLTNLPYLLSHFVQGIASADRIGQFLSAEEIRSDSLCDQTNMGECITLDKAWFSWYGKEEACLKDISLHVDKGSLVAVIGAAGSGKTSLLQSLFGELHRVAGSANVKGRVAFVEDKAWIQNSTLELNILLDKQKNESRYSRTIEACALSSDLDILPAGDETPIGKMGVELTEEQKQKVSLARAVYQNADLYLMDNSLRQLSDGIANHLFRRVIGRTGLLRTKTRIIVTNRSELLPLVDSIIIMKNGAVIEQGTYIQLMENKSSEFHACLQASYFDSPENIQQFSAENESNTTKSHFSDPVARNPAYFKSVITAENDQGLDKDIFDYVQKGLFEMVFGHMKSVGWISVAVMVLCAGVSCFCEVGGVVWLSDWADKRIETSDRFFPLKIYAAFVAAEVFFIALTGTLSLIGSTIAAEKLHTCLLARVMRAPQTFFDTINYVETLRNFDSDLDSVDVRVPQTIHFWLLSALWVPAALVAISFVSPLMILAYFPLLVVYYGIQNVFLSPMQQLNKLRSATIRPLANLFQESLEGLLYIRAFQAKEHFSRRLRLKLNSHLNTCLLSHLSFRWLSSSLNITGAVLVFLCGLIVVSEKDVRVGIAGIVILYSMQIADGLRTLIISNSILLSDMSPFQGIQWLSQIKQEAEWEEPSTKPESEWPQQGCINIQDLQTAYGEGQYPVLHDVNIFIKPGERVAIVGGPSSGKCTLLSTLFRLIEPSAGTIFIDDIDISALGLHDLRSRIAFVPHDPVVFDDSARNNLDPCYRYTDDELWKALDVAELKNEFSNLNSHIDKQMSFDHKYKLALARSFLSNPKVVIVDSMAAPIEHETIRSMLYLVKHIHSQSTIITFYDHPRHALDNDRIILIESGVVVEEGNPSCLYDDVSSRLYKMMKEGYST